MTDAALRAGTSFKPAHLPAILDAEGGGRLFEVHAENYMGAGGPPHRWLTVLRRDHHLSLHGVAMGIGGAALDPAHLARFAALVRRYEPALVSEHLAWSSHGGIHYNDLLPLPYTTDTLSRVCDHVDAVQNALHRPLLLENPATYVRFQSSTMAETDFLAQVVRRTGCGLLLDLNNVVVSAANHGFDARHYLNALPLGRVGQIHLAGHRVQPHGDATLLIDSHDAPVGDAVWLLYADFIALQGARPTIVEWDGDVPDWLVLRQQAQRAQDLMGAAHVPLPVAG